MDKVGKCVNNCYQRFSLYLIQNPICSEKELDCIKSTEDQLGNSDCLQQCSGLLVTNYDKEDKENLFLHSFLPKLIDYMSHKAARFFRNMGNEFAGMLDKKDLFQEQE